MTEEWDNISENKLWCKKKKSIWATLTQLLFFYN